MAGTFTLTLNGALANGGHTESFGSSSPATYTQTGMGAHAPVVTVGTSEEVVPTGDITTEGFIYLKNLDDTNYITYGPESGGAMINFGRLEAGEEVWLRLEPGITMRWQADTADVQVKMILFED